MFSQFFRTLSIQIDISGYINASKHKRLSPDVQQILPNTSRVCVCIYIYMHRCDFLLCDHFWDRTSYVSEATPRTL